MQPATPVTVMTVAAMTAPRMYSNRRACILDQASWLSRANPADLQRSKHISGGGG